ncbi:hypothetical protein [Paenibacillus thalictri]|uniref:Uncharacterized protein n=1 Tax=Paenibacillus thalictri TaxID=2527873 RepID=A0A4Q9DUH7_9BACL|nr:hypothetical protein [Paenibacillus thalictri]TBL80654.1 hypothetical protein EYB31_05340 [Paenibacillus thalictri]
MKYASIETEGLILNIMEETGKSFFEAENKYIKDYILEIEVLAHIDINGNDDRLLLSRKNGKFIVNGHRDQMNEDYFYFLDTDKETLKDVALYELELLVKRQRLSEKKKAKLLDQLKQETLEKISLIS